MSTGPEHFKQAEQYLKWTENVDVGSATMQANLQFAQVHAALALAAATALTHIDWYSDDPDRSSAQSSEWREAISGETS